jgi:two-component system, sensor histidine kinase
MVIGNATVAPTANAGQAHTGTMDLNQRPIDDDGFMLAALRGSLESRCKQAGFAATAMTLYTALTALVLGSTVMLYRLLGWMVLCTSLLLLRFLYSRWVRRRLDSALAALRRLDRGFRIISMLSQLAVGAGIWVIESHGTPTTAYVVTLFIALYGVGAIVNLAHDFTSVKLTLPLLLVQPMAFWLMRGSDGLIIALILAGLGFMMLSLAGNSHRNFNESLRIRFEKDQLLRQLEAEQRATASALAAAEAANRSKSFFMAAASHDLRQPLYAVSILHDALSLHPLGPEPARLLAQQGVAIKATSALFDNLLDLSKFESGVIKPQFVQVRLADLLGELEMEFAPQCAARGLAFSVARGLPDVYSDYELLGRLFRNLISNALRYTQQGGISVQCETTAGVVTIAVSDTGIGIALEDQERVFGAFVQAGNPQRSREGGTGLGLAIVRHIALLLLHDISLSSTPGAGTTVRVSMPLLQAGEAVAGTAAAAAAVVPLRGRTAWIVEDDPLVRSAVSEYLTERGCICVSAASHAELRSRLAPGSWPDFVILDDMLGDGESGLDIARELSDSVPGKRILLTTGNASSVRWRELQATGVRVERKPVAAHTLDAWLATAL